MPPIYSSLFAATNTFFILHVRNVCLFESSPPFLQLLFLSSDNQKVSALILDAPVCLNQQLGTNTEHQYVDLSMNVCMKHVV